MLWDGKIDVLLVSIGGVIGSGLSGLCVMDVYDLYSGNGNNLLGYVNV